MGPLGAHFPIYEMGCHHLPHKVMRNIFQHAGHAAELDKQHTLSQGSTHVCALTPPGPFLGLSPSGTQTLVLPPSGSLLPAHLGDKDSLACPRIFLLGTDHFQTWLAPEDSACAHYQKLLALCVN